MLPSHNTRSTAQSPLNRLAKGEKVLGRRPFIRWVALISFVVVFLWVLLPRFGWLPPPPQELPEFPIHYDPIPEPTTKVDVEPGKDEHRPTLPVEDAVWDARKEEVRKSFLHAWEGYMTKAYPNDELLPVSGRSSNKFNGWAVTLVDSLDTLWLMGLREEFMEAVTAISRQKFLKSANQYAPFFETVIRYLGGYLSAYALSGERILLSLADDLGYRLLPVFDTYPIGIPAFSIKPDTGEISYGTQAQKTALFAEIASCQLEYKYLAKLTGRPEYYERVETIMQHLYKAENYQNLFAERWYMNGLPLNSHYTVGAGADSSYEYFLKQYLLSGDVYAKEQYLKSMEGIINNLLYVTPNRQLLYVTDMYRDSPTHKQEHLSCFLPGALALGVHTLDLPPQVKELHQWAAEGLAYTCWVLYADQASGLGPDGALMENGKKWVQRVKEWEVAGRPGGKPPGLGEAPPESDFKKRDYINSWPSHYILRPETVESLYILWKTTKDPRWRDRGYTIYQAIENGTRTTWGYSSVDGVDSVRPTVRDDMPSYFLAETLKYLYLLFDNSDSISLDKWVFNTEAHPFPTFEWTGSERLAFNITY